MISVSLAVLPLLLIEARFIVGIASSPRVSFSLSELFQEDGLGFFVGTLFVWLKRVLGFFGGTLDVWPEFFLAFFGNALFV